ncbi:MAG: shikimate dehydrogenase [Betaproteobacteria bacterium]|jgi:shikimate dehydrogenase|nr:MAG: shikimate dehydrogenase [Betaproteobacteria bacterium]
MTDRYAVIGHPVAHSQSPGIHAMFAAQTGEDIAYGRLLAPVDGFAEWVKAFIAEGGRGVNVTLPFKLEAYELADEVSERARQARAANTLSFSGKKISADNTDGIGLVRDIEINLEFELKNKRVLLMGAGGAARGVLLPLLEARPARLIIANRTVERAIQLARSVRRQPAAAHMEVSACAFDDLPGQRFELVINATSSSLSDELPPLPDDLFVAGALAYDMMYGKGLTSFLAYAEARNVERLADGLGMLVEQAAESFMIWRGVRPDTQPVMLALRKS